jgi:hypothetical protein
MMVAPAASRTCRHRHARPAAHRASSPSVLVCLPLPRPYLYSAPILVPEFKWAENAENIFLTIELSDAQSIVIKIEASEVTFAAKAADKPYGLDLKLKKTIDPTQSSYSAKGREIQFKLVKAEADQGWWNGLLADKNAYKGRCKIDWDLWYAHMHQHTRQHAAMRPLHRGGSQCKESAGRLQFYSCNSSQCSAHDAALDARTPLRSILCRSLSSLISLR